MFDFAVAGPLLGTIASLVFLVHGLSLTAALDLNHVAVLPVLPIDVVRTSALGGGLVETFLGRGALILGESKGYLPLHPFVIAGFVGILTNALALLPLGSKLFASDVLFALLQEDVCFWQAELTLRPPSSSQTLMEVESRWPCLVVAEPTL